MNNNEELQSQDLHPMAEENPINKKSVEQLYGFSGGTDLANVRYLDKENFWNRLYEMYPNATQVFCDWIDLYKEKVGWNELFGNATEKEIMEHDVFAAENGGIGYGYKATKFHDIPIAMQMGIWLTFCRERGGCQWEIENMFEYVLYQDITIYMRELEKELEISYEPTKTNTIPVLICKDEDDEFDGKRVKTVYVHKLNSFHGINVTNLQVLKSAAGYYIGCLSEEKIGEQTMWMPNYRDSENYWLTREEANEAMIDGNYKVKF